VSESKSVTTAAMMTLAAMYLSIVQNEGFRTQVSAIGLGLRYALTLTTYINI